MSVLRSLKTEALKILADVQTTQTNSRHGELVELRVCEEFFTAEMPQYWFKD